MNIEDLRQILRAWGLFEEQIEAILVTYKAEKDVSTASYVVCHSIFTTTSQDFLAQPFDKSVLKDSALLSAVGTSMHLFTIASKDTFDFNVKTMPQDLISRLSSEKYVPYELGNSFIMNHSHPLSVDDLSHFAITDGKVTSLDLSHGNRVSLSFEFACLGEIYVDLEHIDFSFNPRLTVEKISQFLSVHMFKQLRSIRMIGIDHNFRSNEEALNILRHQEGCSKIEQAIIFDPVLGRKYLTLTFSDLKSTIEGCVEQDVEPFAVDTVVFLTPDIPAFELLCLETPQFLANLKHIYIELPTDYVFDRLFHIKPQIKTINGVPIFNHIVSEATLKSHDSVIRTQMIQLVIDKFYEVCRPIAVDYEGDCYTKSGSYVFAPDKDYFVCALFPSPLVNVKLAYRTSEDFLNASLNSSALVTLSQSSNIAFIWGKQQPSEIPPRYRITLLPSKHVGVCDNNLVLALKSGFPLCRTISCPSEVLRSSIHVDADATNWSIFPALRVALLSAIIANLSRAPYVFESSCTGIAMCAYWINNMRKNVENSIFVGYFSSINRIVYGISSIFCYLLMRSVRDVILLVLPATIAIGDEVCLYECVTGIHIVDEVVTRFSTKDLRKKSFQYYDTAIEGSTAMPSSSETNFPFNLMTVVERSLELIDLRGFAGKKATLKIKTHIIPALDQDGNCSYYSVFSDVL